MGVSGEPRHADGGYACAEVTKKAGSCGEFGGDGVGERIPVDHIIALCGRSELDNQVLNSSLNHDPIRLFLTLYDFNLTRLCTRCLSLNY